MGKALGETFFAEDTLIESITVWRVASQDSNVYGMHLFITATDTTGRPRSTLMLLDGPTVYHPYGDKVHPIPFQFVFDPPFSLPRKGTYYFAVQADPCDGFFSIYDTAAIGPDLYLGGNLWLNGRSIFNGCSLRDFPTRLTGDLAFSIRFCSPTTATRGITWGGMKVRYR